MGMSRWISLAILLGLALTNPVRAAVYTWVGPHGVRHYSDVPHPGAVRLSLGAGLSTYTAKTVAMPALQPQAARARPKAATPQFSILSPTPDQSLFNIGDVLTVSVEVAPPLGPGDRFLYLLDGSPSGGATRLTEHVLHHVYRGTHRLTVEILSPTNRVLESRSVTFFVHQHSILAKQPLLGPPQIKNTGPIKAIPH
ncbi:hypothetical protein B1B_09359 [mine drainage metagenome]|uniref:DUF4124 domain-containing protein n=1 Tax=mine drainage metagenome TaxID=410659 RepID=T1AEV8_9ZZZZ